MKIALIGYGKMGKAIEAELIEENEAPVLKITSQNVNDLTISNLRQASVAIEFTNAKSAFENIKLCLDAGIAVVCGSTGWLEKLDQIKDYCIQKNGSFLYASNFSVGVNIFFEINKYLAKLMAPQNDYEVQMEEIHHTQKKDAPSGTAIALANDILKNIGRKKGWVNNKTDDKNLLQIISKRIDPAAGTHRVKYESDVDEIEIVHTAHNRKGFARGALLAAEFVEGKKGIFEMKDVLGIG